MVSGGLVSKVAGYGEPKIIQVSVRNWDSVVGDEVGATIISGWRKPSPMNHPIFVGRGEIHTSHEEGGYFRNGSNAAADARAAIKFARRFRTPSELPWSACVAIAAWPPTTARCASSSQGLRISSPPMCC